MTEPKLACCGIECATCPAYTATQANDTVLLAKTAAQWSSPDFALTADNVRCDGCQGTGTRVAAFCSMCEVRRCGRTKGVENCAACASYPCAALEKLWEMFKVPDARDRLNALRTSA